MDKLLQITQQYCSYYSFKYCSDCNLFMLCLKLAIKERGISYKLDFCYFYKKGGQLEKPIRGLENKSRTNQIVINFVILYGSSRKRLQLVK